MPQVQQGINTQQNQQQERTNQFGNYFGNAANTGVADYGNIMGNYNNFLGRMPSAGSGLNSFLGPNYASSPANPYGPDRSGTTPGGNAGGSGSGGGSPSGGGGPSGLGVDYGALNPAISGYQNFANTGGFSGDDVANIRARAISPIRGIYDAAQRKVKQAGALNPGLSNIGASQAKLAREMSYALSDKSIDAEGMIADSIRSGKLGGLQGLSGLGMGLRGQDLNAILGGGGLESEAMRGMTGLFGTAPGMAGMFGNQMLQSGGQGIDLAGLRNQAALGDIGSRVQASQIPSTFQNVLGNIGQMVNMAGTVAGGFAGIPNFSGSASNYGGMTSGSGPAFPNYMYG